MKKSKFSESQIFAILKEADSGQKVGDVCRNHGISTATFYFWRAKYGGMDISMLKKYKELEAKYSRLQKILGGKPPRDLSQPKPVKAMSLL